MVAVSQSIDNEDMEIEEFNAPVHLTGGTTEFKVNHTENFLAQVFADMVRIASLLVTKSLEVGYLVASVKVYGLLTEYITGLCTPMYRF